jgi:glycolate oxidase FAD binding subunit
MTVEELQERIAGCAPGRRVLPVAGGTKPPLSASGRDDVDVVDVSALRGIVEYDPAELTFTAQAGTPVAEVAVALAAHDQHLPFDPPLVAAGATLGGVVAAGASGPGALRHGGVRDFVIGVRFVDGAGRLVGGGGKVVKNAAGFDLPKLMVGSLGRLGVMTQLSFKVFPRPRATVTLEVAFADVGAAVAAASTLAAGPRELDAADVLPGGRLLVRLGGDPEALPLRVARLSRALASGDVVATHDDDAALWADAAELRWAEASAVVVRVPVTARSVVLLERAIAAVGGETRISLAANVAWVAWPEGVALDDLDRLLRDAGLTGLALRGAAREPVLGTPIRNPFGERIRGALDPHDRFLEV